jgi:hypothetical protein
MDGDTIVVDSAYTFRYSRFGGYGGLYRGGSWALNGCDVLLRETFVVDTMKKVE